MSDQHTGSDRKAAFTGLVIGVIALLIVVVTVSKLTSRSFAHGGGGKPTASAMR